MSNTSKARTVRYNMRIVLVFCLFLQVDTVHVETDDWCLILTFRVFLVFNSMIQNSVPCVKANAMLPVLRNEVSIPRSQTFLWRGSLSRYRSQSAHENLRVRWSYHLPSTGPPEDRVTISCRFQHTCKASHSTPYNMVDPSDIIEWDICRCLERDRSIRLRTAAVCTVRSVHFGI